MLILENSLRKSYDTTPKDYPRSGRDGLPERAADHLAPVRSCQARAGDNRCYLCELGRPYLCGEQPGSVPEERSFGFNQQVPVGAPWPERPGVGPADIASAGDFAFVANSVKNLNLKVVGTIAKGGGMQIIARRDSGIVNAADLVGKKVAVPKGTVSEFFLVAYCQRNGVAYQRLNIVYLPHEEAGGGHEEGHRECCLRYVSFHRSHQRIISGMTVCFSRRYGRTDYYGLVVTRDDVLRDKPDVIERLLKTMLDAEAFVREHPDEAMQIIAKETGLTIDQVRRGWPENKYEVRLDQDLITLMEAEAQWMIRNNLTDTKSDAELF